MEVLASHKPKFGTNFAQNKKILDDVAIVRSKSLKNEIAGYITTYLKREIEDQNEKENQLETAESVQHIEEPHEEEILN